MKILFLGETYRADALTWIKGIEHQSKEKIDTLEIKAGHGRMKRLIVAIFFILSLVKYRLKKNSYDIVLAERATSYGFFSLFIKSKVHVVAQQGITDAYPETGISNFYKSILQRIVYKNVDVIHAWGSAMTYAQLKSGGSPTKIVVKPKGLDLSKFVFTDHFSQDDVPRRAIVTRSLERDYRHEDIIESIYLLKKMGINLEVWIIGDGSLLNELKKITKERGIENLIIFKGKINNDQLPELMSQCPYYISTPVSEGVSSSLFEAMASGCLPIVTQLPGNKAFIYSGHNGLLVPIAEPEILASNLHSLLSNPSKFRNGICENRRYIESHVDREKNMKEFFRIYLSKIKNK